MSATLKLPRINVEPQASPEIVRWHRGSVWGFSLLCLLASVYWHPALWCLLPCGVAGFLIWPFRDGYRLQGRALQCLQLDDRQAWLVELDGSRQPCVPGTGSRLFARWLLVDLRSPAGRVCWLLGPGSLTTEQETRLRWWLRFGEQA